MTNEYGLEKIQEINLGILKFLDQKCKELNLKYYLAFGTLLGAVRHHGFIPWDDDADVWMTRKDFTVLYNHMLDEKDRYRMCLDQKTVLPMRLQMKIFDTSYLIKRQFGLEKEVAQTYPWIDIFVLDNVPGGLSKWIFYCFARLLIKQYNLTKRKDDRLIYKYITRKSGNEKKSGDYFFSYATCYLRHIRKVIYPNHYFQSSIKVSFEDTAFYIPSEYDLLLKDLYGDYLTPPPQQSRIARHGVTLIKK